MCNSNPLEESSNNSDLVDFDSELDITTGFNSDFKEDFIWNVDTDSKRTLKTRKATCHKDQIWTKALNKIILTSKHLINCKTANH